MDLISVALKTSWFANWLQDFHGTMFVGFIRRHIFGSKTYLIYKRGEVFCKVHNSKVFNAGTPKLFVFPLSLKI